MYTLLPFISGIVYGQNSSTIALSATDSGNKLYRAQNYVKLLPGYSYAAAGTTMRAYIEKHTAYEALLTSAAFDATVVNTSLTVGSIAGEYSVSATGAANYSFPIGLPKGTNSMIPNLGITYSSHSGDGIMGIGWNLTGLSAISVVPRSWYQDGKTENVKLDGTDIFAMDGNRLVATTGTYGSSGTIYATEAETYLKITSYGSTGGPQWFKVETKEGLIMEYGNTSDSRVDEQGGTSTIIWKLNKVYDQHENYMEFIYRNESNDSRIDYIAYTGNAAEGLPPYNQVKFEYTTRNDDNAMYIGGSEFKNHYLLTKIQITSDGEHFKDYEFVYGENHNSFLKSVTEKGASSEQLNTTLFKYGEKGVACETVPCSSFAGTSADFTYARDFNNDGKSDMILRHYYYDSNGNKIYTMWEAMVSTSTNTFAHYASGTIPEGTFMYFDHNKDDFGMSAMSASFDFYGDGSDDLLFIKLNASPNGSTLASLVIIDINGLDQTSTYYPAFASGGYVNSEKSFHIGDYDGDGRDDILWLRYGGSDALTYSGRLITAHSGEQITVLNGLQYLNAAYAILPSDFDGDGKKELMVLYPTSCEIFEFEPGGTYIYERKIYHSDDPGFPTHYHTIFPGDFNGDGKTDILSSGDGTNWSVAYSNGIGFVPISFNFQAYLDLDNSSQDLKFGDFNGDSKTDILHIYNIWSGNVATNSKLDVYYSRGNDFVYQSNTVGLVTSAKDFVVGDFNGDNRMEAFNREVYSSPAPMYYFNRDGKDMWLHNVKNGFGQTITFDYTTLAKATNYVKGTGAGFPLNDIQFPLYVVSSVTTPDGIGGTSTTSYSYKGAKFHRQGKGLLGFIKTISQNDVSGFQKTFENELFTNRYILLNKKESTILTSTGELINEKTFTNVITALTGSRFRAHVSQTINNNLLNTQITTVSYTYNVDGNPTQVIQANGAETTTTNNTYAPFGSWWIPSRLASTSISTLRTGEANYQRVKNFTYTTRGDLYQEIADPSTSRTVTITHLYDDFGNRKQSTTSASGLTSIITKASYDGKGRFAITSTNPLNQTTTTEYSKKWGKPTKVTDADGQTASFSYDGFGNIVAVTNSKGVVTTTQSTWNITNGTSTPTTPPNTLYYVLTDAPGNPYVKAWYDILGREVKKEVEGSSGNVLSVTTYDQKGNTKTVTSPYFLGGTPVITTSSYDHYNRIQETTDGNVTITYAYSASAGLVSTSVTSPLQNSTKVMDASGKCVSSTDEMGTLNFTYYSSGKQKKVIMEGDALVEMEYDAYGNQTKLIDINAGTTLYEYDAYQRLTKQTDANANVYQMQYDVLGRMTTKTGPDGVTATTYITSGNGLNQIRSVTGPDGVSLEYQYDAYGRSISETENIDAVAYTTLYEYNNFDQNTSMTYPSGFKIRMNYNSKGYMTSVKNDAGSVTMYSTPKMNARGQFIEYTLGNGKTTKKLYDTYGFLTTIYEPLTQNYVTSFNTTNGNLDYRQDLLKNRQEQFTYDEAKRLTSSRVSIISNNLIFPLVEVGYSANGNITNKTDLGAYSYDASKINAVTEVQNPGNLISSLQQDITYTPFDRTATISEGDNLLTFTYGPHLDRVKTVLETSGNVVKTRYYIGSYEKEVSATGTREIHYIPTADGSEAVYVVENGTGSYYYLYRDHIGSVVAVTNSEGTVVAEQNFDPWGRYRDGASWNYSAGPSEPFSWLRGFTGHEHLQEFGMINMNNRMYDPILGRMLAVDNFIQNPYFTQNYNRYSYVYNNPLIYTDPSGEFVWAPVVIGAIIGAYIGGTMANDMNYNPLSWDYSSGRTWGYMLGGAVVGGFSGAVGAGISTSGIPFANTVAIVNSSLVNSIGTALYTAAATDVTVSFGLASYNFTDNEWGFLGKKGNSFGDNLGYTFGAIANIGDILAGFHPGEIQLVTEHSDAIGHAALTQVGEKSKYRSLVSFGPANSINGKGFLNPFSLYDGESNWSNHVGELTWTNKISGVNVNRVAQFGKWTQNFKYNVYFSSCVNNTARALTLSGVPAIGIHPFILNFQMYLRAMGARPAMFTHFYAH